MPPPSYSPAHCPAPQPNHLPRVTVRSAFACPVVAFRDTCSTPFEKSVSGEIIPPRADFYGRKLCAGSWQSLARGRVWCRLEWGPTRPNPSPQKVVHLAVRRLHLNGAGRELSQGVSALQGDREGVMLFNDSGACVS